MLSFSIESESAVVVRRGNSLIRNRHPPKDLHRALGIGLLYGPRKGLFLMSKVPL